MKRLLAALCALGLSSCDAVNMRKLKVDLPPVIAQMEQCSIRRSAFLEQEWEVSFEISSRVSARSRHYKEMTEFWRRAGIPPEYVRAETDAMAARAKEENAEDEIKAGRMLKIEKATIEACKMGEIAASLTKLSTLAPRDSMLRDALSQCGANLTEASTRDAVRTSREVSKAWLEANEKRSSDWSENDQCIDRIRISAKANGIALLASPKPGSAVASRAPSAEPSQDRNPPKSEAGSNAPTIGATYSATSYGEAVVQRRTADSLAAGGDDPFSYQLIDVKTKLADLDGDGAVETVVVATTCEFTNCHATTSESRIGILRSGRLVKEFLPKASVKLEGDGSALKATWMAWAEFDPTCCPTLPKELAITL